MPNTALTVQSSGVHTKSRSSEIEPLFRSEAIAEQRTQWLGPVLLEPRIRSGVFVTAAIIAALALVALVFFGSFTRKAVLNGWLVPQQGAVRIFAPQSGVVSKIHAHEGVKVNKGMPLIMVSGELQTEAMGAAKEEVVRRLVQRRNSLAEAMDVRRRLLDREAFLLFQRSTILNRQQRSLPTELELLREQTGINGSALTWDRMRGAYFNDPNGLQSKLQSHFDLVARLRTLEHDRATQEREILELNAKLQTFPLQRQTELAEMARTLAALEQELAEAEARRQIVITAPHDGIVTGIQTEPGGNANPGVPLMTIIPAESVLQADLFGTSRAVGFVRARQRVLLRYHAFPYQKFGLYEGVIRSVSRSAISPSELPQQLSGLASLYGANEPVYRVTVELARQTATAYGEAMPLQAGMQVEADVMLESRRLIEWVFDPLYSLTGRLN
jgi:membrane fusion protein